MDSGDLWNSSVARDRRLGAHGAFPTSCSAAAAEYVARGKMYHKHADVGYSYGSAPHNKILYNYARLRTSQAVCPSPLKFCDFINRPIIMILLLIYAPTILARPLAQ